MLKSFFIDRVGTPGFTLFGLLHISLIVSLIIGIILINIYRNKLANLTSKKKRNIKLILINILFWNMAIYYGSLIYYGIYDYKTNLPLHLCFISGYLFMYAHFFDNKKLIKLTYFCAFIGPIPAIIWPELSISFTGFIFYQQVISHHIFLLAAILFAKIDNMKLQFKDVKDTFILVNIIVGIVYIINIILGSNYIMLESLPNHVLTLYPFLKNINNPIILFECIGIVIISLVYISYKLINKNQEI